MTTQATAQLQLEPHQQKAFESGVPILRKYRILYLRFWMRKGKTLTSLFICNECLSGTTGKKVLFVTKNNAIPSIKSDFGLMEHDRPVNFSLTVINYQSLHKVKNEYNIIIVDEAHSISGFPKPGKWAQQLKDIAQNRAIILLSATETPESYSQYYHQFWISSFSPFAQWHNFYRWAQEFVDIKKTDYRGLPGNEYSNALLHKIQPHIKHLFITVKPDEGTQIPDLEHFILEVRMSKKAVDIYYELQKEKIYINEKGEASIANSGAELDGKLTQIASGTLKFDETIEGVLPDRIGDIIDTSKAEYISKHFAGQKIAILFYYKAEGEMLKQFFPNNTDNSVLFNSDPDLIYINQLQSAMEGVNISSADALVIFNFNQSGVAFIQAPARIQSMYRDKPCPVYWIVSAHGPEKEMLQTVNAKKREFTDIHYS